MYDDFILGADEEIVRQIQNHLADLHDAHVENETRLGKVDGLKAWDRGDAAFVAALLNKSDNPVALFRFMDERTGDWRVGYRTQDGREWFHLLRQMRNTRDSGLLENIRNT